ncbi:MULTISPECIES: class I SAM-dependent methyltransferase [Falsihalocynthiibacter]|uniref:class I SAM-dependent methyltransferase n=1 Tax=Falsihalocynthiibacter TaxID=2854182 RepID=UPI0030022F34
MSDLSQHLKARIAADGPLTVADYMAECLLHPTQGYYTTRDPLGEAGDFTTSPEISQMFGEMIGLCLAQTWMSQGEPDQILLAELGPGRGTLMNDILRSTKSIDGFHSALKIHLIEASEPLRARQADALAEYDVTWHRQVTSLPDRPLYLVANEFFDALPIRQFIRSKGATWCERRIGWQDETLRFGLNDPQEIESLAGRLADTKTGDMVEICAAATSITQEIATRISAYGGAALFIDYGDWRSLGDTFQAISAHEKVSPLTTPGQADLTAHVDFEALSEAAKGCTVSKMIPQGVFLERLGITPRARKLALNLAGPALTSHVAAHRRLTHPKEMGNLFKVLSLTPRGQAAPPGLE